MTLVGQPAYSWRREAVVALGWGFAIFVVTLIPYLVAYALTPADRVFNGFFYIADDASTYVSKMRQGMEGAWGWSDPYLSSPIAHPVLLFLFYIVWGKVAGLLHLSLFAAYHLARLSGAVALVWAARSLARSTLPPGRPRIVAVILVLSGSGLGFLAQILGGPPVLGQRLEALDLHLPELSAFYSILAIPHFAWAAALLALALVQLKAVARSGSIRAAPRAVALATVALLALCLIHPQMLFVLAPLTGLYLVLVRGRPAAWLAALVPFLFCFPALVYFIQVLRGDPVIVAWSQQWRHQAPGFVSLLLALGLPLLLAVVAAVANEARRRPDVVIMVAWVGLVTALLYLPNPVNIQRRLLDGIFLPVAMLAALGLEVLIARRRRRRGLFRRAGPIVTLAVGLSLISTVLVLAAGLRFGVGRDPVIYLSLGEAEAMDWLAGQRGAGLPPAVLSDPESGLYIPERSGDRVYVGHYSETLSYFEKARTARAEIAVATLPVAADPVAPGSCAGYALECFMADEELDYLFYGPREQRLGPPPPSDSRLHRVYQRDGVTIYRLVN